MFSELKIVLPALIALIGTLVGIYFGYRQWKRQQTNNLFGDFLAVKKNAYKEVWDGLEEVYLYVRTSDFLAETFFEKVRRVNSILRKNGLYLEDGEKRTVNDYLDSLEKIGKLFQVPALKKHSEWMRQSEDISSPGIPAELLSSIDELEQTEELTEAQRKTLMSRFRKIIGGDFAIKKTV